MKKHIIYCALSLFALAMAAGCDSDTKVTVPDMGVTYDSPPVNALGGSAGFTIKTSAAWSIEKYPDSGWISSITPTSGQGETTVTLTVDPNPDPVMRSTSLLVKGANGSNRAVTITQLQLTVPPQGGYIEGLEDIFYPATSTVLVAAPIANAYSYKWFKNGAEIPGTTGISCTVTESGAYTVAGVNPLGTGMQSPPKNVKVIGVLSADDIAGTWDVTETSSPPTGSYVGPGQYRITIAPSGVPNEFVITGLGALRTQGTFTLPVVKGTFAVVSETEGTLTIPKQEITPSWTASTKTWFCTYKTTAQGLTDVPPATITKLGSILTITIQDHATANNSPSAYRIASINNSTGAVGIFSVRKTTVLRRML